MVGMDGSSIFLMWVPGDKIHRASSIKWEKYNVTRSIPCLEELSQSPEPSNNDDIDELITIEIPKDLTEEIPYPANDPGGVETPDLGGDDPILPDLDGRD